MQQNKTISASAQHAKAIDAWLAARQQLIVRFNHLCSLRPFDQPRLQKKDLDNALKAFCEDLVDYTALGQLEIFEILFSQIESSSMNDPLSNKRMLSVLLKTTMSALDFNDKYSQQSLANPYTLETDLSHVGERIAHRFDLEDKLLELYHAALEG